jgi:hypothetical protein
MSSAMAIPPSFQAIAEPRELCTGWVLALRRPGFEFTPILLGKLATFLALRQDAVAAFAFLVPFAPTLPDDPTLLATAQELVRQEIMAGRVADRQERTFEYRNGAFREVHAPRWWVAVLHD